MNEFEAYAVPHDTKAEQAVIGSMMIDPACVNDVLSAVRPEDFYLEANRDIFEAVSGMFARHKAIDPVTVLDSMKREKTLRSDSTEYLLEIMQVTPTAAHVLKYAEILKAETMKRELSNAAQQAREMINTGDKPDTVCAYLAGEAERIAEGTGGSDVVSSADAMNEFYNYISKLSTSGEKPYVRTGYSQLDRILGGGLVNQGLYILAARPGCGKTSMGINIADRVSKSKLPTLFMSLEMSREQIAAKRIACLSGMNYSEVLNAELDSEGFAQVAEACGILGEYPMKINRKAGATVDEIGFAARRVKGLKLVVVDYLGIIRHKPGKSLYERTTETSNDLKRLARTLNVPILCLAQLNRESEGRSGGRPRLSDLRDSGAIEQDADGVIFLWRDMGQQENPATLHCAVAKNRHGGCGDIDLAFYLTNGRICQTRGDGT